MSDSFLQRSGRRENFRLMPNLFQAAIRQNKIDGGLISFTRQDAAIRTTAKGTKLLMVANPNSAMCP
ncbi:MAG: hypothetical protein H7172_06090 [Ferruginibacter sp.]|nr:hypothetical protein [Rhodoferax sp.]